MRAITVILGEEEEFGKLWPIQEKRTGFVNEEKLCPKELITIAGYGKEVDVAVEVSRIPWDTMEDDIHDLQNADSDFEREQIEIDADLNTMEPEHLKPNDRESWIFVLGCPLNLQ